MRKVLILGAGGFVGTALSKTLNTDFNLKLFLVDRFFSHELVSLAANNNNITLIEIDLTDFESLQYLPKDVDDVYFLAAIVGVNNTISNPWQVLNYNTRMVQNFITWVEDNNIKCERILFASTSEIYAGAIAMSEKFLPSDESIPICISDTAEPRYAYAISKIFGESAFLNAFGKNGIEVKIVRYHNVYGPGMGFKHVIPHIIQRIFNKESPLLVYGSDQTRAFCHISDAVNGTILAMNARGVNGEVFHIGSTQETSMAELFRSICDILAYNCDLVPAETYPGSVNRRCPDIQKAAGIGYKPRINLDVGLRETVDWYWDYFSSGKKPQSDGFLPPRSPDK